MESTAEFTCASLILITAFETFHDRRRALFTDLVWLITSNKLLTVASTLSADQYKRHFDGLTKLSMYGACFVNLLALVGEGLNIHGRHLWPLQVTLDSGNSFAKDIIAARSTFFETYPRITSIGFESDDNVACLQAADVLTWAARRHLSGGNFNHGFEALSQLFDEQHLNLQYEEEWMRDIAEKIRLSEQ